MEKHIVRQDLDLDLPVLIIGYSRIENISDTVSKLIQLGIKWIYVSIDFSNNALVQKKQLELIDYLHKQSDIHISIWHRTRNHGIAAGIISALDWFFAYNEKGVVLEDDLIFEDSFLAFCSSALSTYTRHEVFMISGNRFDAARFEQMPAFAHYPQIWGWATWKENWWEMRTLITNRKRLTPRGLFSPSKSFFYAGAKRVEKGFLDTWDIPLAFEMLMKRKICLLPPVNLVSNIGFDSFSTHTVEKKFPLNQPIIPLDEIKLPSIVELEQKLNCRNNFLEKSIFGIRWYHVLSPLKFFLELIYESNKNRKFVSLHQKLEESEIVPLN